jgi:hypothetical protein
LAVILTPEAAGGTADPSCAWRICARLHPIVLPDCA